MAVVYVLTQKGDPGDPTAPRRFYIQAKSREGLTFCKLAKGISESSTTVRDINVLAVLNDLTKILKRHLSNGEIVRFGDFGSFQVALTSESAETEAKCNASLTKSGKVTFRSGVDKKEMLATLKYKNKVKKQREFWGSWDIFRKFK